MERRNKVKQTKMKGGGWGQSVGLYQGRNHKQELCKTQGLLSQSLGGS